MGLPEGVTITQADHLAVEQRSIPGSQILDIRL
jgi:hypothetical protein